jgi:hypothetical protein
MKQSRVEVEAGILRLGGTQKTPSLPARSPSFSNISTFDLDFLCCSGGILAI